MALKMKEAAVLVLLGVAALITCTTAACPDDVPPVENATSKINGSFARYTCNSGYVPGGSTHMKCENGKWTNQYPDQGPCVCRKKSCGRPESIDHAETSGRDYQFGGTVYYRCDKGYKPASFGLDHIVCQATGEWTVIGLTCVPVTCPPLSNPQNGKVTIVQGSTGKYEYGNRYRYDCDKGFTCGKGRTSVEVTCRADGTWTEEVQCRVPKCRDPPPAPLQDADVVVNGKSYGDMAVYNCKDYTILHPIGTTPASYCGVDESWSAVSSRYECVAKEPSCTAVPALANAQPKEKKEKYGNTEVVPYKCEEGYTGNPSVECTAGRWKPISGNCEPTTTPPTTTTTTPTTTTTTTPPTTTTTTPSATTAAAACPDPPSVDNALPAVAVGSSKNRAKYTCKAGYKASGARHIKCENGSWTPLGFDTRPLQCQLVSCGSAPNKDNAHMLNRGYFFGDTVYYKCDTGYKPVAFGLDHIVCQPNGQWTVINLTCVPVTCPPLSDPQNGKVAIVQGSTGKYEYGYIYAYTCDAGYASRGRQTVQVTCGAEGKWAEQNITCD